MLQGTQAGAVPRKHHSRSQLPGSTHEGNRAAHGQSYQSLAGAGAGAPGERCAKGIEKDSPAQSGLRCCLRRGTEISKAAFQRLPFSFLECGVGLLQEGEGDGEREIVETDVLLDEERKEGLPE